MHLAECVFLCISSISDILYLNPIKKGLQKTTWILIAILEGINGDVWTLIVHRLFSTIDI